FLHGAVGPGTYEALPPPARVGLLQNAPALAVETATPLAAYMPDLPPAALRAISVPVLLLGGDGSPPMYALERAALAASLPQAEQVVIQHSAHLMHSQNPAAHDAVVAAFLARHGG
ncbi:MAG: alpha/beta hydrolase, partial [Chloroflexota bacterium]|nr:alpha/beta hydrolase [Chloroflexota bacterium]